MPPFITYQVLWGAVCQRGLLRVVTAALLLVLPGGLSAQQLPMLRAQGPEIVDAQGKAVLLRGCNVGGWLLQESYIIRTDTLNSQEKII